MYSREPIREAVYEAEAPFLSVCPFFDTTGYLKQESAGPTRDVPSRGGPRSRLFWEGWKRERPSPFLAKIPLVRWSRDVSYEASTHVFPNARVADVTGALLHFKLFADFPACVEEEAKRGEHFNGASQYAAYREVLSEQPDVSAFYDGSALYEDSQQLMKVGLLRGSSTFAAMANAVRAT